MYKSLLMLKLDEFPLFDCFLMVLMLTVHGRGAEEWEPNAQEKAMLREEFLSQMHERFLEGKDKDFNYRQVSASLMQKCTHTLLHSSCFQQRYFA